MTVAQILDGIHNIGKDGEVIDPGVLIEYVNYGQAISTAHLLKCSCNLIEKPKRPFLYTYDIEEAIWDLAYERDEFKQKLERCIERGVQNEIKVKECEGIEERLLVLERQTQTLTENKEQLTQRLNDTLKENNNLRTQIQRKDKELEECNKQRIEAVTQLRESTELVKQIEEQKETIKKQAEELAEQKAQIEKQLEEERAKKTPDATILKRYEDQLREISQKEQEARNRLNQLQEELKQHETVKDQLKNTTECLARYRDEYKKLYDQYLKSAKYIVDTLTYANGGIKTLDELLIPGIVNNYGYASQYREWFAKKSLYVIHPGRLIADCGNDAACSLAITVNHGRQTNNKETVTLEEYVKELDPQEKDLGGGIKPENASTIQTNSSTIQAATTSYGSYNTSEWYNRKNGPEKYRNPEIGELIAPDDLDDCIPEEIKTRRAKKPVENYEEYQTLLSELERVKNDFEMAKELLTMQATQLDTLRKEKEEVNQSLNICDNNLKRYKDEYTELEKENTQNKNLVTLYKAEVEKLKTERDEAQEELTKIRERKKQRKGS